MIFSLDTEFHSISGEMTKRKEKDNNASEREMNDQATSENIVSSLFTNN